jgi:hypothetical protein
VIHILRSIGGLRPTSVARLKKDSNIQPAPEKSKRGGKREGAGRKPGVVSQVKMTFAERARGSADYALDALVSILHDPEAPHSARVSAAKEIIDRGYGKPIAAHEHEHKGEVNVTAKVVLVPKKIAAEVTTRAATQAGD